MIRGKYRLWGLICLGLVGAIALSTYHNLYAPLPFLRPSPKQPTVLVSMGVVDINRFKKNSKVFQKFQSVVESLNESVHKEIFEKETKLRSEYEQFKKQEDETKEPTQETLKQRLDLDKKHASLEKIFRVRKEEIDSVLSNGLTTIKQTLKEIVDDLGKSYGLNIILNKSIGEGSQMEQSIVLYCNQGLDLTDEVIKRLDKKLISKNFEE
ncbi:MAG: OmpH family outer membrane protein [Alphaproteobacteria bacterium]|jgi:Skp family chaperone for outer membrane proteins|nr:OmpH family outer membrane protein [Alphaproteobacteria bacterium]